MNVLKIALFFLLVSCGSPEEEEENSSIVETLSGVPSASLPGTEVTVANKSYRIDPASLFEKSCNQFFIDFWLDAGTSCKAATVSSSTDWANNALITTYTIAGDSGAFATFVEEGSSSGTWKTSAGSTAYCYLYTGDMYHSTTGDQIYSASHLILTTKTAANYGALDTSSIVGIGASKEFCE